MQKIVDKIYIGLWEDECNLNQLQTKNISHVLIAAAEIEPSHNDFLIYKKLHILDKDRYDINAYFEEAYEFIKLGVSEGTGVLVYAFKKWSAPAALIVAYFIQSLQVDFSRAMGLMHRTGLVFVINRGFVEQLKIYSAKQMAAKRHHE